MQKQMSVFTQSSACWEGSAVHAGTGWALHCGNGWLMQPILGKFYLFPCSFYTGFCNSYMWPTFFGRVYCIWSIIIWKVNSYYYNITFTFHIFSEFVFCKSHSKILIMCHPRTFVSNNMCFSCVMFMSINWLLSKFLKILVILS